MPDYATSQLQLIDERVRAGAKLVTKMGTVQGRDTTGARAMVALDGSSGVPQPVKCFENVIVQDGDRVGLVRFESDWIIVGNYTLRTLGSSSFTQEFSSFVSATPATYADLPTSPTVAMVKYRDSTQLRIRLMLSMFVTVQPTTARIGVLIANTEATVSYDQDMLKWRHDTTGQHPANGATVTTSANLPAGNYTATARWLRVSGTGSLATSSDDQISMEIEEVVV